MHYLTPDDPNRVGSEDYIDPPLSSRDDPDREVEADTMPDESLPDQMAEVIEWLLVEHTDEKKCRHSGACVCASMKAGLVLGTYRNNKRLEAIENAERAELARQIFGDPLKGLFASFNSKYGKKP